MRVNFGKSLLLMTSQTDLAALEVKTPAPGQLVTRCALDACHWRMLMKCRKTGGWSRSTVELDVLTSTFPNKRQPVDARRCPHLNVEYIRKWLLGRDRLTVEFEFSSGSGCHDIDVGGR